MSGGGPGEPTGGPTEDPGGAGCEVGYRVTNSWGAGFTAEVTVTNRSDSAYTDWELSAALPSGVRVVNGWNAEVTQSGSALTARAPSWATRLEPGASVSFGFQADGASSPAPSAFALNGAECSA
nr:cellulose-binding domain-containing protein [Allonocardiopsis opalescens]